MADITLREIVKIYGTNKEQIAKYRKRVARNPKCRMANPLEGKRAVDGINIDIPAVVSPFWWDRRGAEKPLCCE